MQYVWNEHALHKSFGLQSYKSFELHNFILNSRNPNTFVANSYFPSMLLFHINSLFKIVIGQNFFLLNFSTDYQNFGCAFYDKLSAKEMFCLH